MSPDPPRPADTSGWMGRAGWRAAVALAVIAGATGCRRPAAESTGLASLPRNAITTAQRAEWRMHLMWPDDCEDAFQASHAGDGGGILVVRLAPGISLVEVTCAAGSYQPSAMRYKLTEGTGSARSTLLSFPVYTSEDGRDLRMSQEAEVWGESVITPATEIAILSLARQTADCGVWARYSLAEEQPRLLDAAAHVECPVSPGPPAQLSGARPPPGWTAIPRKD